MQYGKSQTPPVSLRPEMVPVLGIITARGGSKAVPRKNILPLAGKPLIAHSIEQAQEATMLTRCIVSTDSEEIAAISTDYGADVPFLRPAYLAEDETPTLPVLQHALEYVEGEEGIEYGAIVILQPTSPLRLARDIDEAVTTLLDSDADTVITVCEIDKTSHPFLMQKMADDGSRILTPFLDGPDYEHYAHASRFELPPAVKLNAAVYALRRQTLLNGQILGEKVKGVMMEARRSIDIDTEDDFEIAEALMLRVRKR